MVMNCRDRGNGNQFVFASSRKVRKPQDGPKEYLLCGDCEQKFGVYETYYKQFILGLGNQNPDRNGGDLFRITGYDYKKARLFLLSVLWRLSVTSIDGFKVQIDDVEQEKLRQMLLCEAPGNTSEFAISATVIGIDGENNYKIFSAPKAFERENMVVIYMGGIMYSMPTVKDNEHFKNAPLLAPEKWPVWFKHYTEVRLLMDMLDKVDLD
jgi:hypothetical protein